MGSGNDPINTGIPYGNALPIHLEGLYNIQNRIASVIEFGGTTGQKVNYDAIKALVELAISSIPDDEQAANLRETMDKKEEEAKLEIAAKNNHSTPTSDDEQEAMRQASFAIFNLIHVVYDDDMGIRKRLTLGFA